MIPSDITYDFPGAAYLIFIAFIVFGAFWVLYRYRNRVLDRFASQKVLNTILIPRSRFFFWSKVVAICLAWILVTFALMQPKGRGRYPEGIKPKEAVLRRRAHDVIFLIDASASMSVTDTRTGQTRLDYAKDIAEEIVRLLKGQTVALHAFTSDTTKLAPPTMDYLFVRLMLDQMRINEGDIAGTNLVEALADVRSEHYSTISQKRKTLIMLTDGEDNSLETLRTDMVLNLVGNADVLDLRVFTIGMGSKEGGEVPEHAVISKLEEPFLQKLSQRGRGKYYFANDFSAPEIARDIVTKIEKDEPYVEIGRATLDSRENLIYEHYYQVPLGIAMFLLAFATFFPDARKRT